MNGYHVLWWEHWDFRFWLYFRSVFRFLYRKPLVFRFWCTSWFADFFSIWFPVFVKNTNGFADLICDVVWVFSFLGSGFSSVWAEIMRLHWSRIMLKPMYASLVTDCTRPIRVLITGMWRLIKRFWRFCKRFSVLINIFLRFRGFAWFRQRFCGF